MSSTLNNCSFLFNFRKIDRGYLNKLLSFTCQLLLEDGWVSWLKLSEFMRAVKIIIFGCFSIFFSWHQYSRTLNIQVKKLSKILIWRRLHKRIEIINTEVVKSLWPISSGLNITQRHSIHVSSTIQFNIQWISTLVFSCNLKKMFLLQ